MTHGIRQRAALVFAAAALLLGSGTLPALGAPAGSNANETVVDNLTANALAHALVGAGVTVSNATYTGSPQAEGAFSFSDPKVVGFNQGIVMGSGNVGEVVGPNTADSNSGVMNTPGDPNLDTLSGYTTYDASVLEFDFVPTANQVTFTYAFASDEYPEWAHTVFNDVFAFFVNGDNCATERQTAGDPTSPFVPVAVNNINQGNPVGDPTPARPDLFRPNYYTGGTSALDLELDGITTDLICQHAVTPGVTNHMKLAIADASDQVWDSAVFIQAGSLVSNENPTADLGLDPSAGAAPLAVTASIEGEDPNSLPLTYSLDWGDGSPAATGSLPSDTTLEHHTYTNGGSFLAKLTISNGTLTGVDTEDVDVTGGAASAPVVTQNPSDQTVSDGSTFSFTAHANGNPVPDPQWQVSIDGGTTFTDIPGATLTTFSGTASLADDGNLYQAVFTNTEGTTTTTAALLTVTTASAEAPLVTSDPEDQSVLDGEPFSFTSTASGTPDPTVQWQVSTDGGDTWGDVLGATATTYSGTATLGDDGNQYRAVFTNASGSATSGDAQLSVAAGASAPVVTLDPLGASLQAGDKFTFSAAASGNPAPTVQWEESTDGGTTYNPIPGATDTTYGGAAALSDNGDLYRAVFTNSAGSATTSSALLSVSAAPVAPIVTTNPSDVTTLDGTPFSFSATATGSAPLTAKWQVSTDGGATFVDIPGAITTTYSGTASLADDGNQYRAVFTNPVDSATTTAALLTVTAPDTTPPKLKVWLSPEDPFLRYQSGIVVEHSESDDSGQVTVNCGTVDTSTVGAKSVTCEAKDPTGNTTTVTKPYLVGYQITVTSPTSGQSYPRTGKIAVSFQVADANGVLSDADAATIKASLVIRFDNQAPVKASYAKKTDVFSASIAVHRAKVGDHNVTIDIVVGSDTVAHVKVPVTIV